MGNTRTGSEDLPGAALDAETVRRNLRAYIANNPRTVQHANKIDFWMQSHPLEYIERVLSAAVNGDGVNTSGHGLLITALDSAGNTSVPPDLKTGRARLRAGLPWNLERLAGRSYRTSDGRTVNVNAWSRTGDAETDDRTWPAASTRLWTLLPENTASDNFLDTSSPERARVGISPELLERARARFSTPKRREP
jgi:hypothetical protein